MAHLIDIVKKGSTDRSVTIRVIDSTDGTPETGFAYNTSGIDLWYRREGAAKTSITEVTLAALTTAHTDGGVLQVADGEVRLDLPDAAFATGANYVDVGGTATGMIVIGGRVRLVDYDPEDGVRLGLTALPNAAAAASGGLHILGTNAVAVSYTAGMTISNASGSALTLSSGGSNGNGLSTSGNGTGAGVLATGGATGHGISAVGGATSGDGLRAAASTSGTGITASGAGTTKAGIAATGGATTSAGISATGGSTSGDGILTAATSGHGIVAAGAGTTKHGINATGGSTTSHGIAATGGGVGHGILATSGGGSTGDGIKAVAASTNGNGINAAGVGTGAGQLNTGGATGAGLSLVGGSTSGNALATAYTSPVGPIKGTGVIESGILQSATGTTAVLRSATSFADDLVIGATLVITDGTGAGQARLITDWVSSTDTATVATWTTTPDNTSTYEVWSTAAGSGGSGLDAAGVRAAIGMSSANLDTQLSGLDGKLDTIDNFVDTEVAAIKAKTDNLPSDPADASVVAGLIAAVDAKIDTIDTNVDAILDDTGTSGVKVDDSTPIEANIKQINDVPVAGDGDGTPWGPAE